MPSSLSKRERSPFSSSLPHTASCCCCRNTSRQLAFRLPRRRPASPCGRPCQPGAPMSLQENRVSGPENLVRTLRRPLLKPGGLREQKRLQVSVARARGPVRSGPRGHTASTGSGGGGPFLLRRLLAPVQRPLGSCSGTDDPPRGPRQSARCACLCANSRLPPRHPGHRSRPRPEPACLILARGIRKDPASRGGHVRRLQVAAHRG